MVASVVVLGMGESKLIGLVTFDGFDSGIRASVQSKRAEQKAPRDLNNPTQSVTVREPFFGQPRPLELWKQTHVESAIAPGWARSFCPSIQSDESPRAPPPGGFTILI